MEYSQDYQTPNPVKVEKGKRKKWLILSISLVLILGGLYLLWILWAPNVDVVANPPEVTEAIHENKVIIPKIQVDAPIIEGGNEALEQGVWHRYPDRGAPNTGGNFVLTGHRFKFALTPKLTKEASVFYNIDKLEPGDKIVVHWNGQSYNYKVIRKFQVNPGQIEIEQVTGEAKMTLYSCFLSGSNDGREVIEATLEP